MTAGWALALAAGIAVLAWIVGAPLLAARRRRALAARSLMDEERRALEAWLPFVRDLPAGLRDRLERLTAIFVGEKQFIGCGGLAVTPEMKVAIAAQACLLVLGRNTHVYDRLRSVLVYPSQFVVPGEWHDEDGVVTEESRVLAGESWDVSRVILSWEDVDSRGAPGEAYNVVIHEFAHYLDHESGGAPWIAGAGARRRWFRLLDQELERLRAQAESGERTFLDPYAAEDRGEFFAVASEAFFEEPAAFARERPALYRALADVYRLDPAGW
ncbi:MAG TPA: M90 family metallopeptidase [Steroidobacteraceae bacterium]|nr:M90 family metallopeptidase [Steroidobacteraceae bacterium]